MVRSSQLFLRRLIDLSTAVRCLHHHISLSKEVQEDIRWWRLLLQQWNGISIFPDHHWITHSDFELYTDAASSVGYGAVFGQKWFCGRWPPAFQGDSTSIQWKELFPIYAACYTWGDKRQGKRILFHTDNLTDVAIWNKQSTKSPKLMAIAHKLFLVSALYDFEVKLTHIEGRLNPISDSLSRLQILCFRQLHPDAKESQPSLIQRFGTTYRQNESLATCLPCLFITSCLPSWSLTL